MKHAILITAYKDFEQLADLCKEFDEDFNIYIHIDKKSEVNNSIDNISKIPNVKVVEQKYVVNWGGLNHLKSYLFLSEEALKDSENEYFHLITGEDYPIKGKAYFDQLFESNSKERKSYIDCIKMPRSDWSNGGMDRLEYYNFYDVFNAKSFFGKVCIFGTRKLQSIFGLKRKISFRDTLYGGSTYWSLPRNSLQFVLDFTVENPKFFKRFKHTFCAEEIYFQTVIMNSEHAKNVLVDEDLRFIDWSRIGEVRPAYLDETDYETIIASNKLFARKIVSKKLIEMLRDFKNRIH